MSMNRLLFALLGLITAATVVVVIGFAIDQGTAEGNATVESTPGVTTVPEIPTTTIVSDTEPVATTSTTTLAPTTTTTLAPTTTTTRAPATTTTLAPATTTTLAPATTTTEVTGGSFNSGDESEFRGLINGLRSTPLASDSSLNGYARNWARHMAESGAFSHSNIGSLLGPWSTVGENISMGSSVSAMFAGLKASSGHHANMVNESFTHLGVGVWVEANGTIWTAHVFGG